MNFDDCRHLHLLLDSARCKNPPFLRKIRCIWEHFTRCNILHKNLAMEVFPILVANTEIRSILICIQCRWIHQWKKIKNLTFQASASTGQQVQPSGQQVQPSGQQVEQVLIQMDSTYSLTMFRYLRSLYNNSANSSRTIFQPLLTIVLIYVFKRRLYTYIWRRIWILTRFNLA